MDQRRIEDLRRELDEKFPNMPRHEPRGVMYQWESHELALHHDGKVTLHYAGTAESIYIPEYVVKALAAITTDLLEREIWMWERILELETKRAASDN